MGGIHYYLQPPELHAEFAHHLAKDTQPRADAEFAVDIHATPSMVAAAAEPAQRAIEENEEIATVRRLFEASTKYVAWDVPTTLEALQERRVMVFAVDDAFRAPGARCMIWRRCWPPSWHAARTVTALRSKLSRMSWSWR